MVSSGERSDAGAAVLAACDADEVLALTAELISIESHRLAPGHETAVAVHLRDVFATAGIEAEIREVVPGRPNVIATMRGTGGGPTLMFNGHTDTVPPGTMAAPFEPTMSDGLLRGRGACDMKGGLAAQVCAMLALKRAGAALRGDLIFTGVIAEEDTTSLGTMAVVESGPRADMVVVAEPTGLSVAIAHKGFDYYQIEIEGRAAHSSRPETGISAIYRAAAIATMVERDVVGDLGKVRHPLLGPGTVNVASIIGYARSESATALGRKGPIEKPDGGTVPDTCTISLDHRRLPGGSHLDFVATLDAAIARLGGSPARAASRHVRGSRELETHPPLDTPADSALVREAVRLAHDHAGRAAAPIGVPYWSDAALFNAHWKVPAIVFGPGDIAVAHSNAECVPVDELIKATRVNATLALALLGGAGAGSRP
jgi:acetylornithine deacetylase/succinyl-diaminopimelate desuccinylase